jgi:hypothetical protein
VILETFWIGVVEDLMREEGYWISLFHFIEGLHSIYGRSRVNV